MAAAPEQSKFSQYMLVTQMHSAACFFEDRLQQAKEVLEDHASERGNLWHSGNEPPAGGTTNRSDVCCR